MNSEVSDRLLACVVCARVIINDSIDAGSQIPWVEQGAKEGYTVLLLNPNCNSKEIDGWQVPVKVQSSSFHLYTAQIRRGRVNAV